jgi:hypothetical protein
MIQGSAAPEPYCVTAAVPAAETILSVDAIQVDTQLFSAASFLTLNDVLRRCLPGRHPADRPNCFIQRRHPSCTHTRARPGSQGRGPADELH